LEAPANIRQSTHEATLSMPQAMELLVASMQDTWAEGTIYNRQHIWHRFRMWCERESQEPSSDEAAVLFIVATMTTPQAMLSYCKIMSALFGRFGWPRQDLTNLAASLRLQGAEIPIHQAEPISRDTLLRWAGRQADAIKVCVMIAWKTASRWDECFNLTRKHFISLSPSEVIIDWDSLPKGRRRNPYKPSKYTVITGLLAVEIFKYVSAMPSSSTEILCTMNTQALDRAWSKDPVMKKYSAHSIKRGALSFLISLAEKDRTIDPTRISLLAKHEHVYDLASATIRYSANGPATARVLRTQDVTQLL
jgi:hypothetical protein